MDDDQVMRDQYPDGAGLPLPGGAEFPPLRGAHGGVMPGGIAAQVPLGPGFMEAWEAHNVASMVPSFSGDPKKFRTWERSIDKAATLLNATNDRKIMFAFQRAEGVVSDFIQRFLDAEPLGSRHRTWETLKGQLATRFAEVTDPQYALTLLRRVKQERNESVPVYGERMLALAQDAFTANDLAQLAIQRQLIALFVDGLLYDNLKLKMIREDPNTFEDALLAATREQSGRCRGW